VAYNKYRNWARGRRRLESRITAIDVGDPQRHDASDQNLEDRLDALRRAIDRLPAKQKEVVLMHYLEETSVKEVAMLLSVSPKTVEGRLYQARRALYQMLDAVPRSQTARRLLCL
jgi:RNA polymerase sigma-70 factor (ECF subfamily)